MNKFKLAPLLLLLLIVFILSGCSDAGNTITPLGYYNLLFKAKNFLAFCVYLANSETPYCGQIISRAYYAYYNIARLVHIGKTNLLEREKHTTIWQQNKKEVRKKYGDTLKHLRTYYDYDSDSENESFDSMKSNILFLVDNNKAFQELIKDAQEQTLKFYKYEEDKEEWIRKCDELFECIEKEQQELQDAITRKMNA